MWFDENGKIKKASGNYTAGKEEGESGNTSMHWVISSKKVFFKNGLYHGDWTWYYPNKSLHRKEQYRKGKENGEFIEWNITGELLNQGVYQNGLKQGDWIEDVNDHREEGAYLDGMKDEEWKHFNTDGKQSFKGTFIYGLPDGKHTFYQEKGGVDHIERYEGGVKQGKWIFYNSDNLIEQTREYRQGELIKVDGQTIKTRREKRADRDLKRTKTP